MAIFTARHGVPSYSVSGTDANEDLILSNDGWMSRADRKFGTAAMEAGILLQKVGGELVPCTANTHVPVAILTDAKPAGITTYFCLENVLINRRLLNFDEMGTIVDADLDAMSTVHIRFAAPIFGGLD